MSATPQAAVGRAGAAATAQKAPPARKATPSEPDFLRIVDLVKQFGETTVVDRVNLGIARHEMFALLGSSGCGKSTLLRMMAGLETPTSGRILLDGEDITALPAHKRPVNMMFQSYALFPHMTVAANVAYGLKREGVAAAELKERVADALDLVQMRPYALRMPSQLSGGQQQRAALARSLVKRPKLLLLDEPMSALDKKIRQETQFELGNILCKVGVTCVLVTHDQEEAMTMADRIAVMSEGRLMQLGTPEDIYESPGSRFTAEFIGSTNIFTGLLREEGSQLVDCPELALPLALRYPVNARAGAALSLSLRPESIALSLPEGPADLAAGLAVESNATLGVVEQIAYMGSYSLYYLRVPAADPATGQSGQSGRLLVASVPRAALNRMPRRPDYDDTVGLHWSADSLIALKA
jgi:putrescine transport system ATP-binding protein